MGETVLKQFLDGFESLRCVAKHLSYTDSWWLMNSSSPEYGAEFPRTDGSPSESFYNFYIVSLKALDISIPNGKHWNMHFFSILSATRKPGQCKSNMQKGSKRGVSRLNLGPVSSSIFQSLAALARLQTPNVPLPRPHVGVLVLHDAPQEHHLNMLREDKMWSPH